MLRRVLYPNAHINGFNFFLKDSPSLTSNIMGSDLSPTSSIVSLMSSFSQSSSRVYTDIIQTFYFHRIDTQYADWSKPLAKGWTRIRDSKRSSFMTSCRSHDSTVLALRIYGVKGT